MFHSVKDSHRGVTSEAAVDIAPLIDVVFILLLFFLVTASFGRDRGLEIDRPQLQHGATVPSELTRVTVTASGDLYWQGQPIGRSDLNAKLSQEGLILSQQNRPFEVVVVADKALPSGELMLVVDLCKGVGADEVVVAGLEGGR